MNSVKKRGSKIVKKEIFGFDIETYGKDNDFYMGSVVSKEWTRVFYNKDQMIEYINTVASRNSVFYATNLQFDLFALFAGTGEDIYLKPQIRGSRIITATYNGYKRNIKFSDTMNFLPISVEALGKIVGVPKLPKPKFLGKKPTTLEEKNELEQYNIMDSTITYKFMEFVQEYLNRHGGALKNTAASSAFYLWQENFLEKEIKVMNIDLLQFCFEGYYGGRTECFKRGLCHDVKGYDINSMYPHVMEDYTYPNPNTFEWVDPTYEYIDEHMGVADVTVTCPRDLDIPYLPYRHPETKRLCFPTGTFRGVYTHFELQRAVDLGYTIEKIHRQACASGLWDPFIGYVRKFYKLRLLHKKEGSAFEQCDKLLLNCLYGRLGLRPGGNTEVYHADTLTLEKIESMEADGYNSELVGQDWEWYYFYKEEEFLTQDDINPSMQPLVAMHVTAYARHELYQYLKDSDPYYCDTDSVYTKKELPTGKALGQMKLEKDVEYGCFVRPKFYWTKERDKGHDFKIKGISGLKDPNKEQANLELVKGILNREIDFITRRKFASFKQSNRKYNGKYYSVNEHMEVTKGLNLEDTKRDWNGKTFNFDELQHSKPLHIGDEVIE